MLSSFFWRRELSFVGVGYFGLCCFLGVFLNEERF